MPRIEEWSIISNDKNPYLAPELRTKSLCGYVYGHGMFPDGSPLTSSSIMEINFEEGYAQTRNTKYKLGKISSKYEQWCKDNEVKLISSKREE